METLNKFIYETMQPGLCSFGITIFSLALMEYHAYI